MLSTITANKTHLSGRLSVTSIKLVLTILPLLVVLRSLILASEEKQPSKGSQRESQQTVEFKLVELSVLVRSDSNIKENEDQESKQKEQGLSHSASLNEENADCRHYLFAKESDDFPVVRLTSKSVVEKSIFAFDFWAFEKRGVLLESQECK